jgi:hypothetical protein
MDDGSIDKLMIDPDLNRLIKKIEGLIDKVAKTISAEIPQGKIDAGIKWTTQSKSFSLPKRVEDVLSTEPIENLRINISNDRHHTKRKKIAKDFRSKLKDLDQIVLENGYSSIGVTTLGKIDIVAWKLSPCLDAEVSREVQSTDASNPDGHSKPELRLNKHAMCQVDPEELRDNGARRGKLRKQTSYISLLTLEDPGITRLALYFQKPSGEVVLGAIGTGWLADESTVVTAGHCVLPHKYRYSRLAYVDVFLAHQTEWCQTRVGTHVAAHWNWYRSFSQEHDVAYIRLEQPFDKTSPMSFMSTPTEGKETDITVTGYPKSLDNNMYFSECKASWRFKERKPKCIEYALDTDEGEYICL